MQDNYIPDRLPKNGTNVIGLRADYQDEDLMLLDNAKLPDGQQTMKTHFNFFMLCHQGSLSLTINDIPLKLGPSTLLRCPTGAVVSNVVPSDDFKYMALAITNHALQSYMKGNINIWNTVIYKYKMYTMDIDENDFAILRKFHELLHFSLESKASNNLTFRKNLIKGLVETELNAFCFKIEVEKPEEDLSPHTLDLFNRFLDTLQKREVKRLTVEQYASELCISSKYLSTICKMHSGKTPKQWIQEYTVADISYYLRSTNLSVKEISYLMGFPNSSFFCKYVKEHLHYSPSEYRQKQGLESDSAEPRSKHGHSR